MSLLSSGWEWERSFRWTSGARRMRTRFAGTGGGWILDVRQQNGISINDAAEGNSALGVKRGLGAL